MKKNCLTLILPSLLSGCAGISGSNNVAPSDTPALVFVDGQISESAGVLALTQQRLSPPKITPPPRVSVPETVKTAQPVSESRPLPSPTISQNFSRLIITGKPGSAPVTLSPTARNRTVSQWIKTLLPEGWKFRQENAATPKLNTKLVSWSANDQWTRSLNRLLEEQHLWGHLDWNNKTLTVTTSAAAPAQDTATTISPAAMVTTSTYPESPTTANSQNKPRNPFRGNSVSSSTPAATPTPTGSTVKSIPLMTGTPVKPVSQGKEWRAPAGTTLRENIIKWAEETKCESMASTHWMVIWPLSVTDYRLDAPLMFRGSFESAMEQVFELYRTAQKPLTLNNLMWQGDINGLLDLMASRSGLYWRMDNGRIVFYLTETRTYPLHMLNTKTSSSSSVSSGSTSTMGATGGQDNSASGDATSSQSTTVGQEYDLYEDIRKTIEAMLTPEKGRYWLSASSSTLTVTDTPAVQEAVARYVDEQNSIMNRQVALNVQVLSVSNTRNEQFGLDWNLVYKSLHSAGATLNNASGDFTGATSAGVSILDTATGNAAKFSGSSLLIKALSEQGDVSVVTSQESTVTNLTPVPIQMADQTVYVAQSATTTTTDVGATTTLTPGMITTGFNMTLLPLIQKTGNLQLQMNFNLSDPPTIRSFTSKDGNSYIEMPYTKLRSLSQKVNLKEGQSLVVTGFDQNNTTTSKAGTFTPANPLFGGSQTGKNERSTLVIIITPTFPSGGNNG